jgi:WD40 repeat protein
VGFSKDGTRLMTRRPEPGTLHLWSIPDGKLLETWPGSGRQRAFLLDRRLLTFTFDEKTPKHRLAAIVREQSIDGGPERTLGRWQTRGLTSFDVDRTGEGLISLQGSRLLRQDLEALGRPARGLGRHEGDASVWHKQWADRIVTADAAGAVLVWNAIIGRLERTLRSPASARAVALDPQGRFLATAPGGPLSARSLFLFDLQAPRPAEPAPFVQDEKDSLNSMAFHPQGQWLATGQADRVLLWNLAGRRSLALRGQMGGGVAVGFTPDGRLVASSDAGAVRIWSLSPEANEPERVVWSETSALVGGWAEVDAQGRFVVVIDRSGGGRVVVVPIDGSPARVHRTTLGRGTPNDPSIDPAGHYVAYSNVEFGNPEAGSIRIVDLATGEERVLQAQATAGACERLAATFGAMDVPAWLPDGRLVSDGVTGLRVWDLVSGASRQIRPCRPAMDKGNGDMIRSTPDSRAVVHLIKPAAGYASDLSVADLATGASRDIASHGGRLQSFALDPTGTTLVTGDADGLVRVGPLSGQGEPHLLYGHGRAVTSVAVSPDGKWIASGSGDDTIRLWPMPEGPPLHTLAYDALLAKLRSLTNLRVVPDPASATGYKLEPGPFPGWARAPEW